jgi:hypothetical protein
MKNEKIHNKTVAVELLFTALIVATLFIVVTTSFAHATPAGPVITWVANSTAPSVTANRSDLKGTITTLSLSLNQQDYKWKAYVGNVTGSLTLDDANTKTIYDWTLGSITGEVYATRSSSTINWANVSCVNQTVINAEQTALSISATAVDSINKTFNNTVHKSFLIGSKSITNSTCRSTATFINDTAQFINESTTLFQEILLRDDLNSAFIYSTLLETDQLGYDGSRSFDFQMLVAEDESSNTPQPYYFYVELG